jgi:predicted TIM-barrel fold metal-dependent hydrolase
VPTRRNGIRESWWTYLKADGRHKVLFGTNYPMITATRALGELASLGLDAETERLFRAGNARGVFRLPPSADASAAV